MEELGTGGVAWNCMGDSGFTLPILCTSPLSPSAAAKVTLGAFAVVCVGASLHYASPAYLKRVLSSAMDHLEKVYMEMASTGFTGLSADDIQTIVSACVPSQQHPNRETVLKGRSITLLWYIEEVKNFETRLKIFKQKQQNAAFSSAVSQVVGTAHLRRYLERNDQ
ncbi:hypothetical protein C8R46DRAFT_1319142 [Mycena filopes]|nr:hypothetical protein C8R46DRAFT_1319142 [Mycena filopes]